MWRAPSANLRRPVARARAQAASTAAKRAIGKIFFYELVPQAAIAADHERSAKRSSVARSAALAPGAPGYSKPSSDENGNHSTSPSSYSTSYCFAESPASKPITSPA